MKKVTLFIKNWKKHSNGMKVLEDFWLSVYEHEILYLSDTNLMELDSIVSILRGEQMIDSGESYLFEEPISAEKLAEWCHREIMYIAEGGELIETVSITDNFFICSDRKQPLFARDRKNRSILRELFRKFDLQIDVSRPVEWLSNVQKYQILLLKAMYHSRSKIILMDIRKMLLSDDEFIELFKLLRAMTDMGTTIIMVGYYYFPVISRVDSVAFIENGRTLMHRAVRFFNRKELGRMNELKQDFIEEEENPEARIKIKELNSQLLRDVNLAINKQEIITIYYTEHKEAKQFYDILTGRENDYSGTITVDNKKIRAGNISERVRDGIVGISEYQKRDYLFENLTGWENYAFNKGMKLKSIWWKKRYYEYLSHQIESVTASEMKHKFPRQMTPLETVIVKYASFGLINPKVLVCMDPFAGVDAAIGNEIKKLLWKISQRGTTVIVMSRQRNMKRVDYVLGRDGSLMKTKNDIL